MQIFSIKEIKRGLSLVLDYAVGAAVVFLIFVLAGIFFAQNYPDISNEVMSGLEEEFSFIIEMGDWEIGAFIFFNNTLKVFLFTFMGVLFTLPTILFLTVNGFVLGFVMGYIYPQIGLAGLFYSLFLHGIFELTALFIGSGLGILLGLTFLKEIGRCKRKDIVKEIKKSAVMKDLLLMSLRLFVAVIIPLLLIAAIIEGVLLAILR